MVRALGRFARQNSIGLLALFIALGGTSYAAISLPKNSVGTKQIKNGAVTKSKINNQAISALAGNTGPQGPQGNVGAQGPQGKPGTNGTNGTSVTSTALSGGNPNCANGGSSFTSASGTTYACNGAQGAKGDPGPSSLDAMQGAACTFNGHPSTLKVSVDSTTGAVSMTCTPVYQVSFSVTGGSMTQVDIRDQTTLTNHLFFNASSGSVYLPKGTLAIVELQSGDELTGGGSAFTFTCPAGADEPGTFPAFSNPGLQSGTYYTSEPLSCVTSSLSGALAVTASFS
jgi:hypothetical protein